MHKLIIDTDPGVDDAQAIAYALAHPDIELLGLTSVFGNASIEQTTANALTILEHTGHPQIPVAKGASRPLQIDPFPAPDFVHGDDGLGNLRLPKPQLTAISTSAADFLLTSADRYSGELVVVAIGPLTNLAQALEQDANFASKVKQVIVMGGTVKAHGNVSPVAEANFINDPDAADIVCRAGWPLTLIGLDVTMQVALTDSHFDLLRTKAGSTGQFLWDSSRFYVDFYSRVAPQLSNERACAMHDASALVYLTNPKLFGFESGPAVVVNSGAAQGQLIMAQPEQPYLLQHWQNRPPVSAAVTVDAESVLNTFLNTLIAAKTHC